MTDTRKIIVVYFKTSSHLLLETETKRVKLSQDIQLPNRRVETRHLQSIIHWVFQFIHETDELLRNLSCRISTREL